MSARRQYLEVRHDMVRAAAAGGGGGVVAKRQDGMVWAEARGEDCNRWMVAVGGPKSCSRALSQY